jgi:hypothetical protein
VQPIDKECKTNKSFNTMRIFIITYFVFISFIAKAQSDDYKLSLKFGGSVSSNLINLGSTYDWYGNSKGPEIFLGVGYKNIHLNTSYRYFDEPIKKNLPYNNTNYFLPKGANVRMVLWNLNLSYEKEIIKRFFIEPTIGYLRDYTSSNINDRNGNEFDIKDLNGFTIGANIIKYIKITDGTFLGFYLNGNYNFLNFSSLNPGLSNSSFGFSLGAILKGTDVKKKKMSVW